MRPHSPPAPSQTVPLHAEGDVGEMERQFYKTQKPRKGKDLD